MIPTLNRFILVFALIAALLTPLPARSAEPFTINAILSLTGYAAFIGQGSSVALRTVEEQTNQTGGIDGRPIHFEIVDDQSNPATALTLANGIIARGAAVIMGPNLASNCDAVFPRIVQDGPLTFCLSPSAALKSGTYTFGIGPSNRDLNIATMRYFKAKNLKRIAMISSTDASGQDGERQALAALALPEYKDMALVASEHFGVSELTIAAQAARVKSAKPDAIVVEVTGTPLGTVLHSLHDAGLDVPVMGNASNINPTVIGGFASFVPTTMLFTGYAYMAPDQTHDQRVRAVQQGFIAGVAALKERPTAPTASVYDPARVVVDAFRHLGTKATSAQIKDYVSRLKGFPGINGFIDFTDGSQRGVGVNGVVIVQWDGAKLNFAPVSAPGGSL